MTRDPGRGRPWAWDPDQRSLGGRPCGDRVIGPGLARARVLEIKKRLKKD